MCPVMYSETCSGITSDKCSDIFSDVGPDIKPDPFSGHKSRVQSTTASTASPEGRAPKSGPTRQRRRRRSRREEDEEEESAVR